MVILRAALVVAVVVHAADAQAQLSLVLLQRGAAKVAAEAHGNMTANLSGLSLMGRAVAGATTTTPDPTGMTLNAAGDLEIFLTGLILYGLLSCILVGVFMCLRVRYPYVYSGNVVAGIAPSKPDLEDMWSWWAASRDTTTEEAADAIGLDCALLLEFATLGKKIMAWIGIPMLCIMGPMNCAFGGFAAGEDYLSYLSFGNVENGSWLYWIHAFVVWGVVFVVQASLYKAQERFLELRFNWLKKMPRVRANTILVEGVPEDKRTDKDVRAFFDEMFPGNKIESAYIVKDTSELLPLVKSRDAAAKGLNEAEARWTHDNKDPEKRPQVRASLFGGKVDAIEHYTQQLSELNPQIKEKVKEIEKAALDASSGATCVNAFVTFKERKDAEVALRLDYTSDRGEWEVSTPPAPSDVVWKDFQQDPSKQGLKTLIGYGLVAGLYFAYMPMVIGITNIAYTINLGPLQVIWASIAPTAGLQFMVAMLPTFLILIFQNFFTLRAETYAQLKLQQWYFNFQVVFVILATAVGQDATGFTKAVFEDPFSTPMVMARTMPFATHFYMNFLVLQWMTHCTNVVRNVQLMKFKAASIIFEEDEAKKLSEPEDQDYYGLGSRSARFTINLCIGIVFGTLSPPINLLTWINFWVCRVIYGYLIPFAETKKGDLGGDFWVTQLQNIFVGNIIYCILMAGVLCERAADYGPCLIAAPSLIYVLWSRQRFMTKFSWEKLPYAEIVRGIPVKSDTAAKKYVQPELTA